MSVFEVTAYRLDHGIWTGDLRRVEECDDIPEILVSYRGAPLEDVQIVSMTQPGTWELRVNLPVALLSDGVHTVLITDARDLTILERIDVAAGYLVAEELRSEVNLLREELDMLKRSFRRYFRDA